MKSVNARHVPNDLNPLQWRRRIEVAKEMLDNVAEDSFIYQTHHKAQFAYES